MLISYQFLKVLGNELLNLVNDVVCGGGGVAASARVVGVLCV